MKRKRQGCLVLLMAFLVCLPCLAYATTSVTVDGGEPRILQDGDTLHLLTYEACYRITEEGTLTPCSSGCYHRRMGEVVQTNAHTTYALRGGTTTSLQRWTPDKLTPWEAVAEWTAYEYQGTDNQFFTDGTAVYRLAQRRSGDGATGMYSTGQWDLTVLDMATGESKTLQSFNGGVCFSMTLQPDGTLVLVGNTVDGVRLQQFAPDTGRLSTLATLDMQETVEGIAVCETGGWYLLSTAALYHVEADGDYTLINYVPSHEMACTQLVISEAWQQALFCANTGDGTMKLCMVPTTPEESVTLVVDGSVYLDVETRSAFEYAHPHVRVVSTSETLNVQEVLTLGNDGVDILFLRSQDGTLQRALDKGYFVDLADVPELNAFGQALYPIWQQEVMRGEKLAALPCRLEGDYRMTYNTQVWEELGLGDVPQSCEELFQALEGWTQDERFEDIRLINFAYDYRAASSFLALLLQKQCARYAAQGEMPVFQEEGFLAVLERLERMMPKLGVAGMLNDTKLMSFYPSGLSVRTLGYDEMLGYQNFALSMLPEEEPTELVQLTVAIVNPYSKNQALAKEYLVAMVQCMQTRERKELLDEGDEGVELEDYDARLAEATQNVETSREIVEQWTPETGSQENYDVFLWGLAVEEGNLQNLLDARWVVSPEEIVAYRDSLSHMVIERENSFTFLWSKASTSIQGFLDGRYTAADLARQLDDLMRIWTMENQ